MKYLVEIEIRGPLEAELRAADTVGGCLMIEQMVRDGILTADKEGYSDYESRSRSTESEELWLTVRAMEHVTVPTGRVP